jgi:hypothetical protein
MRRLIERMVPPIRCGVGRGYTVNSKCSEFRTVVVIAGIELGRKIKKRQFQNRQTWWEQGNQGPFSAADLLSITFRGPIPNTAGYGGYENDSRF